MFRFVLLAFISSPCLQSPEPPFDGLSEILVGAPRSTEGAARGGKVWILSGKDGAVVRTHVGRQAGGHFGFHCKRAGDLDLDGTPDYLVSAPGGNSLDGSLPPGDAGLEYPGRLFVYSGATGPELFSLDAEGDSDRYGFEAVQIGPVSIDEVRASFSSSWNYPILGYGLLRGFRITIDHERGLIRMEKNAL